MGCDVLWCGVFVREHGYGSAARGFVRALKSVGINVGIKPLVGTLDCNDPLASLACTTGKLCVYHVPPNRFPGADVYYTYTEFERPPSCWDQSLRSARLILTSSEFCGNAFSKVPGIRDDGIKVVPHVIDESMVPEGEKSPIRRRFQFLFGSVFTWVARKKPESMWQAFCEEFPLEKYPDVGFVNRVQVPANFYNWLKFVPSDPRIFLLRNPIKDLSAFYRSLDCYCSPTAGEGWGITLFEAMACGIPVIGSRHGGNMEFMNDGNSCLVDVDDWSEVGDDPTNFLHSSGLVTPDMRWKLPKVKSIRAAMRDVYDSKLEGVPDVRAARAAEIRCHFTPEAVGGRLAEALSPLL